MPSSKIIFLAAAEADKIWKQQLLQHFAPLENAGDVQIWHDEKIAIGRDQKTARQTAIDKSTLFILLISPDFIASDFFASPELEQIYQSHLAGRIKIMPILIRPCNWSFTPYSDLPLFLKNEEAIANGSPTEVDKAFSQSVVKIMQILTNDQLVKTNFEDVKNTFTDIRNGKIYKTIKVKGKTWLAENLNFKVDGMSYYYDNNLKFEKEHGCLYTWDGAIKACPPGWHLPNIREWNELIEYFGGPYLAFKNLCNNGDSQLNIQLSGKRNERNLFVLMETDGFYWTSEEQDFNRANYFMFDTGMHSIRCIPVNKTIAASCRYIRDN